MIKVYYTDQFVLPLPAGHTFPMSKYRLLRNRLSDSGLLAPRQLLVPPAATDVQLARAHSQEYILAMSEGRIPDAAMKKIGFPWSPELVERSRRSSGATIEAARSALSWGYGINLAGGTHHAFYGHGEGYCLFNDSIVAIRQMQHEGRVNRAIVIDLDVHQGNGTAAIAQGDETIFTFSMHGAKNYPIRKEQSDLDIELPDGTGDAEYLARLHEALPYAIASARPQLALYLAGADPHEGDRLGRLKLTKAGLKARDEFVFESCAQAGLPLAIAMAGGYGQQISDIVDIHWQTVQLALSWAKK